LQEGLQKTIDWFILPENLSKYKTGIYNIWLWTEDLAR
jgi:hypothetical protein